MYFPGEVIILLLPVIFGILKGELVWDGSQFTFKEE